MLVGIDRVKDVDTLKRAYNDEQGVTAEFNKNVLHVLNRELEADFDPDAFEHHAFYDENEERIESFSKAYGVSTRTVAAAWSRTRDARTTRARSL